MNRRLLRWWPLLLLFSALRSPGQNALRKRISLPAAQISAGDLRIEISRQTGLQFSFGSNTIRPGQLIRLPQKSYTAKELLDAMQQQLKADYKIYEDHIIFTKRNNTAANARSGKESSGIHQSNVNAKNGGKSPPAGKPNTSSTAGRSPDARSGQNSSSAHKADFSNGKQSPPDVKTDSQNTTAQNKKKGAAFGKFDQTNTSTDYTDVLKGKESAQNGKTDSQNTVAQNKKKSTADARSDPSDIAAPGADPQHAADERNKAGNTRSDSIISKTAAKLSPDEQSASSRQNGAAKADKPASKQNIAALSSDPPIVGKTSNQLSLPLQFPTAHADERIRRRAYRLVPERRPATQSVTGNVPPIRERKSLSDINNGIFSRYTAAGIEATEYFPANGALKAGVSILHGIIGYSSNGSYGSLRYGAGTRWSFNERWHVQASFTTGVVEKKLESDSGIIIQKTIEVRERLHRIGLQAERTLGKRWGIVGGLSWNMLNRTNTDNGARLSPGARIFNDPVPEAGYRALKPFYTISSKFSEGNKTWKDRWLGVQIGLYFRL